MARTIHEIRQREHVNDDPNAEHLYPEDTSAREIEEDIEHTRSAMDDTISELLERLAPRNLLADVVGMIRESMRGGGKKRRRRRRDYDEYEEYDDDEPGLAKRAASAVGHQAVEVVKNHPLPTALITAGIVWMAMEPDRQTRVAKRRMKRFEREMDEARAAEYTAVYGRIETDIGGETGMRGSGLHAPGLHAPGVAERMREGAHHAKERIGDAAHSMREKAGDAAHSVREKVGDMGHAVREGASHAAEKVGDIAEHTRERLHDAGEYISHRASDLGESVREGYHKTRDVASRAMDEYPLAIAIGAVGLGVLAGMLLPRTRTEDKYFGEASDEVKEKGREIGHEAMDRGSDIAEKAVTTAATEAGEAGEELFGGEHHEDDDEHENEPARQHGERFRGTDI